MVYWHGQFQNVSKHAEDAVHKLGLANDTINDMQVCQRDVAALDARYTGELADAKAQLIFCSSVFALAGVGCVSTPPAQRVAPPPPAAWAMLPALELLTPLNGIISPPESGSAPSPDR